MSNYETVLIEHHGAVAVVSLNRPDKLNSFDGALRRELLLAVREVNAFLVQELTFPKRHRMELISAWKTSSTVSSSPRSWKSTLLRNPGSVP
jgi:hypothetical protein